MAMIRLLLIVVALTGCQRWRDRSAPPPVLLFDGTGTSRSDVVAIESLLAESGLAHTTASSSRLDEMGEVELAAHRLLIIPPARAADRAVLGGRPRAVRVGRRRREVPRRDARGRRGAGRAGLGDSRRCPPGGAGKLAARNGLRHDGGRRPGLRRDPRRGCPPAHRAAALLIAPPLAPHSLTVGRTPVR